MCCVRLYDEDLQCFTQIMHDEYPRIGYFDVGTLVQPRAPDSYKQVYASTNLFLSWMKLRGRVSLSTDPFVEDTRSLRKAVHVLSRPTRRRRYVAGVMCSSRLCGAVGQFLDRRVSGALGPRASYYTRPSTLNHCSLFLWGSYLLVTPTASPLLRFTQGWLVAVRTGGGSLIPPRAFDISCFLLTSIAVALLFSSVPGSVGERRARVR